jgi:two-component system nitrate/nitrite response regulator NarL
MPDAAKVFARAARESRGGGVYARDRLTAADRSAGIAWPRLGERLLAGSSGLDAAIRVAVIGRTRLYRESLQCALAREPGLEVVGGARDVADGIVHARDASPDAVVIELGVGEGPDAVRRFAAAAPGVRIVALVVDEHSAETLMLAEAGVAGYVTRDDPLSELLHTLESAVRDELRCSPRMAGALLRRMQTLAKASEQPSLAGRLTPREREILQLIDAGLANKDIASRLHIELATVKNHVHHILEKLEASRRGEAVARLRGVQLQD